MGLIERAACPSCRERGADNTGDNLAVYEDGSYCYSCGYSTREDVSVEHVVMAKKDTKPLIPIGEYKAIKNRGISLDTAKKYKTTVTKQNDDTVICHSVYKSGAIVAQKLKFSKDENNPKKPKYTWLGDKSQVPALWGMDLYEPNNKLSVTICEGELDMLCRSSMQKDQWPVLSLVDGAGPQSLKSLAAAKEYLLGFKKIVLMFDGDETGRKCAEEAAALLGPTCVIGNMPDGEDICSMYQKGRANEIQKIEITATRIRPKDIVTIDDYTDEELNETEIAGVALPFPQLNKMLLGLKPESLYMLCAGTGLGKSTFAKELAIDLMFNKDIKVGCVFLEQGDKSAMKDFIAMSNNVHCETYAMNPASITDEQRAAARSVLAEKAVFYKHFGSLDSKTLISKIEYMMQGCGCDFVILDHISMAISGNVTTHGEWKDIDILMTSLRTLVHKTGKSVIAISHLSQPGGGEKDYNHGGAVTIKSLRGSSTIGQISDYVIALERNQFDENNTDLVRLKVLKSRRARTGYADTLQYSYETGRLTAYENLAELYDETLDTQSNTNYT